VNALESVLRVASLDLADLRLRWALVGGLAVSARTEPRFTIGHLLALKLLSRDDRTRPQDRVDLAQLLRAAQRPDLDAARHAVVLIQTRGFQRERDLPGDLERLITHGI
jgi:hypothetical protein